MNVEAYRRTIRRRVAVMTALAVAYAGAMLLMHTLWRLETGYAGDFLLGAVTAVVVGVLVMLPRYTKALRDDQALRRLWNEEHDERRKAMKAKAGAPMLIYTSVGMIAVGLLIGPWSVTASMTLLLAATAQLVVCAAVKLVCMRTM